MQNGTFLSCGILSMIPGQKKPSWASFWANSKTPNEWFHPGRPAAAKKRLLLAWKIVLQRKTKREGEEKNFLLPLLSSVCCKRSEKAESSDHLQCNCWALLSYVYMRIIWLIMPLLWLCEKANEAIWIVFFAHNFSSTWCIMVFKFVSDSELTRFFTSLSRRKRDCYRFSSFHQVLCFQMLSSGHTKAVKNRHLLLWKTWFALNRRRIFFGSQFTRRLRKKVAVT